MTRHELHLGQVNVALRLDPTWTNELRIAVEMPDPKPWEPDTITVCFVRLTGERHRTPLVLANADGKGSAVLVRDLSALWLHARIAAARTELDDRIEDGDPGPIAEMARRVRSLEHELDELAATERSAQQVDAANTALLDDLTRRHI